MKTTAKIFTSLALIASIACNSFAYAGGQLEITQADPVFTGEANTALDLNECFSTVPVYDGNGAIVNMSASCTKFYNDMGNLVLASDQAAADTADKGLEVAVMPELATITVDQSAPAKPASLFTAPVAAVIAPVATNSIKPTAAIEVAANTSATLSDTGCAGGNLMKDANGNWVTVPGTGCDTTPIVTDPVKTAPIGGVDPKPATPSTTIGACGLAVEDCFGDIPKAQICAQNPTLPACAGFIPVVEQPQLPVTECPPFTADCNGPMAPLKPIVFEPITPTDETGCAGGNLMKDANGNWVTVPGTGCDTTVTEPIVTKPIITAPIGEIGCAGGNLMKDANGNWVTVPGTGCDTTVTDPVTDKPAEPTGNETVTATGIWDINDQCEIDGTTRTVAINDHSSKVQKCSGGGYYDTGEIIDSSAPTTAQPGVQVGACGLAVEDCFGDIPKAQICAQNPSLPACGNVVIEFPPLPAPEKPTVTPVDTSCHNSVILDASGNIIGGGNVFCPPVTPVVDEPVAPIATPEQPTAPEPIEPTAPVTPTPIPDPVRLWECFAAAPMYDADGYITNLNATCIGFNNQTGKFDPSLVPAGIIRPVAPVAPIAVIAPESACSMPAEARPAGTICATPSAPTTSGACLIGSPIFDDQGNITGCTPPVTTVTPIDGGTITTGTPVTPTTATTATPVFTSYSECAIWRDQQVGTAWLIDPCSGLTDSILIGTPVTPTTATTATPVFTSYSECAAWRDQQAGTAWLIDPCAGFTDTVLTGTPVTPTTPDVPHDILCNGGVFNGITYSPPFVPCQDETKIGVTLTPSQPATPTCGSGNPIKDANGNIVGMTDTCTGLNNPPVGGEIIAEPVKPVEPMPVCATHTGAGAGDMVTGQCLPLPVSLNPAPSLPPQDGTTISVGGFASTNCHDVTLTLPDGTVQHTQACTTAY